MSEELIDPDECPNCGAAVNKFVGDCDECGHDRWRAE